MADRVERSFFPDESFPNSGITTPEGLARTRGTAKEASVKAAMLMDKSHPGANVAFIYGDSTPGAIGRSFAELNATRIFVSGLDEGMTAVDSRTIRKVYDTAMEIAKLAMDTSTRETAAGLIQNLSNTVGALRRAIEINKQPVPSIVSGSSPYMKHSYALAEPSDTEAARQDIEKALQNSVVSAINDLNEFIEETQKTQAEEARALVLEASEKYSMLEGGADAVAWYAMELAEFKDAVDDAGKRIAGTSAKVDPVMRQITASTREAEKQTGRLAAQLQNIEKTRSHALSGAVQASELENIRVAAIAPLLAEVSSRKKEYEVKLQARARALGAKV